MKIYKRNKDYITVCKFDRALCRLRILNEYEWSWSWFDSGESSASSIAIQFRDCVQLKNKKQD